MSGVRTYKLWANSKGKHLTERSWIKDWASVLNGRYRHILGGTVGLVLDHGNKANNTIK